MTHPFLRRILLLDAASCAAMGLLLVAVPDPLGRLLGLPASFLTGAGALLLPVAAFMIWLARRPAIPASGLAVVVAGNALWVAASLLLPAAGLVAPNALGWTFLLAQALLVAVLAGLEARPAAVVG